MKSQMIKTRNLPDWTHQPHMIHVKPVAFLTLVGLAGIALFVSGTAWVGIGLILSITSVFALLMMPDRILIQFTPEYMVLYNHRDKETCTVIYWEDLVNWQYEFHPSYDTLTCFLVDGSVQHIDLYAKRPAAKYLNQYAPGKEIKNVRMKENA